MGGMFGNRGNSESREQTIANGEFHSRPTTRFLDTLSSEPEDPTSSDSPQAVRSSLASCNSPIYAGCRAQVYEGPQEYERRRGVPLRRMQAKGDEELHAY